MTDGGTWQPPEPARRRRHPTPAGDPLGGSPRRRSIRRPDQPTEPSTIPMATVEPNRTGSGRAARQGRRRRRRCRGDRRRRASSPSRASPATRRRAAPARPRPQPTTFLDALDDEDVLGLVDVLLPGERATFRQPLEDLVGELQRLEVLSEDADLAKIDGIDISITDRDVDVAADERRRHRRTSRSRRQPRRRSTARRCRSAPGSGTRSRRPGAGRAGRDVRRRRVPRSRSPRSARTAAGTSSAFYSLAESLRHEADDPDIPADGRRAERRQEPRGGDGQPARRGRVARPRRADRLPQPERVRRAATVRTAVHRRRPAASSTTPTSRSRSATPPTRCPASGDTRHLTVHGFEVDVIEADGQRRRSSWPTAALPSRATSTARRRR